MMLRDVTGEDDNAEDDHEKDDNVDAIRRNCAIEMHVNMSQETSEEPLQTENYRNNPAAQNEPRTLCASLRKGKACQDLTGATLN